MADLSGEARRVAEAGAVVLDAKGLRALAHPVRVRLIGLLRKHGPSTATRLAERLGVNSATASYHLRRLGAAGFVEEDEERGNSRERWWRSVYHATWFDDPDLAEREPDAALSYLRSVAAFYTLCAQRALEDFPAMPRPWREVLEMSGWPMRLTPAEAASLRSELREVIDRYRHDTPAAADAPAQAERVSVIMHVLPELDTPAAPSGRPAP
ncbi:helix-turn-helix domain-containing protein [Actinomadura sp. DC4]|uniref:ArsR/SmtB family transcription factor n=1 Tax=Actinomadura sp. DC4 TaxID=3055069 RepID=UPI0025B0D065|nr:helix-turn-helix domain-containing protein [Actinomadura sp. DC4]MDN3359451.1 helix-turn-helix domain-containing protein [Actinomadura sp. DC4]